MSRLPGLLLPLVLAACSGLDEAEGGVVALEIRVPSPPVIEIGEQLQLSARPLNAEGDSVAAPVIWLPLDATLSVDRETGIVTGVSPGTGRVQARSGSLTSELVTFSVLAPADTLIIVGDPIVTVPPEPGASGPLVVRLESFDPVGPLASRPVVYEITSPPAGAAPVVELTGGVQIDTLTTGADGTVTGVSLNRAAGAIAPDSAIVAVRASRTRGAVVPGSGQRFIIRFQ